MSNEQRTLQARQATAATFGELVNAMRGMAAARARRAREHLAGADAYGQTVTEALSHALSLRSAAEAQETSATRADDEPTARGALWLVFGAEQGFNGGFSETLLAAAHQRPPDTRLMVLGHQAEQLALTRGLALEASAGLIAQADAAAAAAVRVQAILVAALARRRPPAVVLVYAEVGSDNHYQVVQRPLLPLDPTAWPPPSGPPPFVHLPPAQLVDALTLEHVAARLTRAVLHSHAAENLSRLAAMAAAHENVSRLVERLAADERRVRQEGITAEIIELAAGLRALAQR